MSSQGYLYLSERRGGELGANVRDEAVITQTEVGVL
jgi:hypothetical protein